MSALKAIWRHDYFPNHAPRTYIVNKIIGVLDFILYGLDVEAGRIEQAEGTKRVY
jgi:hypothetical protein